MKLQKLILPFILLCFYISAEAKVTLPKIFSDNMVLQRESQIPIWGMANAGEKVTVTLNKQTNSAIADTNGKWFVTLKAEKAANNLTLKTSGENTIEIKNVAVGEVWLCSGQSNMEWSLGISMNAQQELANSDNPNIRHIKIERSISGKPETDIKDGVWKVSNPQNAKDFSGVAYFFARNLYQDLKVPIGLINASWGGTNIETWISREGFESSPEFREMIAKMPAIDVDSMGRAVRDALVQKIEKMQGSKLSDFNAASFLNLEFNDEKLPELYQPNSWENQGLNDLDGVVWLRKSFYLTAEQSRKTAVLELAKIDDEDQTFINGKEVGKTYRWDAERRYEIPAGVLKEGKNVVVIKVTDTGGAGGIYGEKEKVRLSFGDSSVDLSGQWKYQVEQVKISFGVNQFPSLAFNAMVNPVIPFKFRGAIWYQGESNASRAFQYRTAFPLLINDWRKKWNNDFPFYFVQLATYTTKGNSNEGSDWAELREAQTMTLRLPKTGMAVTTDIGNPKDIHPLNKQDVGKRLAAMALHDIFKRNIVSRSPSFKSMKIVENQAIISFENIGGGLMTTDSNGRVLGFEIAGNDKVFYSANAVIKGNTVIVSSEEIANPLAVRFGWIGDASANNLFNKEGFPAVPFRTDDWKTVTKDEKYKIVEIPR